METEQLIDLQGHQFEKRRHGIVVVVTLEEVKTRKVKLRQEGHKEAFQLPIERFLKDYTPIKKKAS